MQRRLNRTTGKVLWFSNDKGYGFLEEDSGVNIFCHQNAIQMNGFRTLRRHDLVEFEIVHSIRGREAAKVIKRTDGSS